jgi:hypothetical protein
MTGKLRKQKGYHPSVLLKIRKLIVTKLHYKLDDLLDQQKEKRLADKQQTNDSKGGKVINITKYKNKFS